MTDDEFADRVRAMVEHENGMRDQRLNWLLASQGLLITALGITWDKDDVIVTSLAVVGVLFCVSIGANLFCNTLAIRRLAAQWKDRCTTTYDGPGVTGLRSSEIKPRIVAWLYPWNVLPLALCAFWLFVLCYKAAT